MLFPLKVDYALRALFELARRQNEGPVHTTVVAKAQLIPQRFLEVILTQLQRGGFVKSTRGKRGGFELTRPAEKLSVGEVVAFLNGPLHAHCGANGKGCPLAVSHGCLLGPVWNRTQAAASTVMDYTTFRELVDDSERREKSEPISYTI